MKTPANIVAVHNRFDEIVNYQIVPKKKLYDWIVVPIFGFTNSDELFVQEV